VILGAGDISPNDDIRCEICVVGAGAAGVSLALEFDRIGLDVVLLEAGDTKLRPEHQELFEGHLCGPHYHAPLTESRHRQLGGTTTVWGGRCLPLDSIDFFKRDYAEGSGWPFGRDELDPYYRIAQDYCQVGEYSYQADKALPGHQPGLVSGLRDTDLVSTAIERWGPPTNFGRDYQDRLRRSQHVKVILGANCLRIELDGTGSTARSVQASTLAGNRFRVKANSVVLAAGGLEVTRLLLVSDQHAGIGKHSDWLGRGYMGHLVGSVATVSFNGNPQNIACDYELTPESVYCRRRFWVSDRAQRRSKILNFAATLENTSKHDPAHNNGVLSVAYLALRTPILKHHIAPGYQLALARGDRSVLTDQHYYNASYRIWPHIKNVFTDFGSVIKFIPVFAYKRFIQKPRIPGFFVRSRNNTYDFKYCGEQTALRDSRVSLAQTKDRLGMPQLEVDYRIRESDIESIYRAHNLIDRTLRTKNLGWLAYKSDDVLLDIRRQAGDGVHQLGTTRMSVNPRDGVVDENCRVHGTRNLYVASSSVFPTSGHANPTLTIVALAVRLAHHINENCHRT
jgi:choline dehydrogenase-like flavoprotein